MGFSDHFPGMRSGQHLRNIIIGLLAVILFPLTIAALPFYLFFAVGTNRHGLADRLSNSSLSRLPGLDRGGWTAGAATFVYVFVVFAFIGAAGPGGTPDSTGSAPLPEEATTTEATTELQTTSIATPTDSKTTTTASATVVTTTSTPTTTSAQTPSTTTEATTETTQEAMVETTTSPETETTVQTTTSPETGTTVETTTQGQRTTWEVSVVRVVDGDTFEVRFPDGHTEDVRLLGVDTPEVHVENQPAEFEGVSTSSEGEAWLRDWGHKASEFARTEIGDETIQIRVDEQADRRGSYGRLLVYAYDDGELFNAKLIRQGSARMYDSEFSKRDSFTSMEATAQQNDVGLWNFESTEKTTTTSSSSEGGEGSLSVATIHADSDDNDHGNKNGEYIVFKNTGDSALDLSGWTVSDEADHVYYFPEGFTLESGATVTLYTGSGTNTDSELYWSSSNAIWNNGGDTIIVTTDSGTVVVREKYS